MADDALILNPSERVQLQSSNGQGGYRHDWWNLKLSLISLAELVLTHTRPHLVD